MALDSNYVERVSRKLRKVLKKKSRPLLPARVHKLRTDIRRLEAAAEAVLSNPKRSDKRVLKDARRIRKQAGRVRDMDVLTANALTIGIPKLREELIPLIEYLGSQRYKEARQLRSTLRTRGSRLRKGVEHLSSRLGRRIEDQESVNRAARPPEVLVTTVGLLSDLKRPSRFTPQNLHPYRLKVKKLRDVVRLSPGVDHSTLAGILGDVKDAIGTWHDWQELASLADHVLEEPKGALAKAIKHTVDQKYARAISLTKRMRREFLRPKPRGLAQSIVQTTASMAQ
jgi:CHAD domain-containing protein